MHHQASQASIPGCVLTKFSLRCRRLLRLVGRSDKDLGATLDLIKAAVLAGELDAAIDAASSKVRAGFAK